MDEKRMRAVRAIANATRKKARILINHKENIGLVAEIQIVKEDNQYHTINTMPIQYAAEEYQAQAILNLLRKVTDLTNDGYIFADSVEWAPEYIDRSNKYIEAYVAYAKSMAAKECPYI